MTVTLTPEQIAWIDARVARGDFLSQEDAARRLLDAAILDQSMIEADDLAWAKSLVDEALAEADRGDVISHGEYRAGVDALLAKFKA